MAATARSTSSAREKRRGCAASGRSSSAAWAASRRWNALPDVLFVIDVGHEKIAVHEASKLGIPVVAIVDTNCSPDGVDYMIPGNDDAMRAIELYAARHRRCGARGQVRPARGRRWAKTNSSNSTRKASRAQVRPEAPCRAGPQEDARAPQAPRRPMASPRTTRSRNSPRLPGGEPRGRSWRAARRPARRDRRLRRRHLPKRPLPKRRPSRASPQPRLPRESNHGSHSEVSEGAARAYGRRHDGVQEGARRNGRRPRDRRRVNAQDRSGQGRQEGRPHRGRGRDRDRACRRRQGGRARRSQLRRRISWHARRTSSVCGRGREVALRASRPTSRRCWQPGCPPGRRSRRCAGR